MVADFLARAPAHVSLSPGLCCLDLVASTVWDWLLPGGIGISGASGMLIEKLGAMALIALTAYAYDGSLISRFGTTPGKAAFGLRVHGLGGAPLPARAAFKRARIQLFSGLLLLFWFPMLQVINAFILRSRHGDHMPWDKTRIQMFISAQSAPSGESL